MRNFFNNGRRPSIFEIATAYENGNEGDKKPRTKVVVNTNRLWYGDDSTVSAFIATAYDEQGNRVDAMNGYFLEPATDYMKANKEGSDRAIMSGTYDVITQKEMKKRISEKTKQREENIVLRYDWYIDNVPGRSGIAIHSGKNGKNTTGCFIPGSSFEPNKQNNDFIINDNNKKDELFHFFQTYGTNGIKINVGPDVSNLIE
ncbi:MAG: hypothetical protein IIW75_08065 [Bacteroidaceae bacterium]|jgi:hypothetical protein|nr:hypothetical protein [Bacteroidaceae bacterium]